MLSELKRFDATGQMDVEDLVALSALAASVQAGFNRHNLPVPEWLDDKARQLARAIALKTADQRALRLKEIAAEEARLETNAEKRARLQTEKEQLVAGI
jgi:hypothetical protein